MKDNLIKSIFIIFVSILLAGCTVKYYDTAKLFNDFKTEGFLDRDHYQVLITGTPAKEALGLVAQRESALNNAKAVMDEKILDSLVNYELNFQISKTQIKNIKDIQNIQDVKKYLKTESGTFLQFGQIAYEYYNIDNSAVLVYRIFKEDLISKIESIKPDLILSSALPAENKKTR